MTGDENRELAQQQALIEALQDPACYAHATDRLEVIETHISWVILVGPYAYKIKKALNLGFLDYTGLQRRRFFCQEELRLNARTAPAIYLETVAITGPAHAPRIEGGGEALEYAVKMHRFAADALLSLQLEQGRFTPEQLEQIAEQLARFHAAIPRIDPDSELGSPAAVLEPVLENFTQIAERVRDPDVLARLERLRAWSEAGHRQLHALLQHRHDEGFVRECHGDLHLNNIVQIDEDVQFFDGIEFSERLRWIDVISEIAFLIMDLKVQGHADDAQHLLNDYLALSGDYAGLALLRFYIVYRAMVRAKVAAIGLCQHSVDDAKAWRPFFAYLDLAEAHTLSPPAYLLLSHGLSGSGKSFLGRRLAARRGLIHIRSDIERKRLHGLDALAASRSGVASGMYGDEATAATYERLLELAETILSGAYPVLVDATFLQAKWRRLFYRAMREKGIPCKLLDFQAPEALLYARIELRARKRRDASEADAAVLAHQLSQHEPLSEAEVRDCLAIDTRDEQALERLDADLRAWLAEFAAD